jgi:hypothetical protein
MGMIVFINARYQYSTIGTLPASIINSIRMRFELKEILLKLYYQKMRWWL